MRVEQKTHVFFSNDDALRPAAHRISIEAMRDGILKTYGAPVVGHVMVTEPKGYPDIHALSAVRHKMRSGETALHVDLFTGETSDRPHHTMFSSTGVLHFFLRAVERTKRRNPRIGHVFDMAVSSIITPYAEVIENEIARQITVAWDIFGNVPYVSYHLGLHYVSALYDMYHGTLHKSELAHRHMPQYNGASRGITPTMTIDSLNTPRDPQTAFLQDVDRIQPGDRVEVVLHLQNRDGPQQYAIVTQPNVVRHIKRVSTVGTTLEMGV